MRTRISAIVAAAATALAITAAVLLGLGYASITTPSDDADGSLVGADTPAQTVRTAPVPLTPAEVSTLDTHEQYVDDCMADAGFPEYAVVAAWDPEHDVDAPAWDAGLSPERSAAATVALWGATDSGADYRWKDAGCAGYATHMIGADGAS